MTPATPPPTNPFLLRSRSLGAKLFIILLLALGMSVSGCFVDSLASDRAEQHGVHQEGSQAESASKPPTTVAGIRLVDSYRSTTRSLRYLPLFLGLVFLTYFLFEVLTKQSVHPAQYALVGVAQIIFYLLLLSLAEHLGFDLSFLIAGGCTVGLFALNTEWVFRSRRLGLWALGAFTAVYSFIYVLLRVEAYALLIGAFASFAAVAAAMYISRNVDWYGDGVAAVPAPAGAGGRESWLE